MYASALAPRVDIPLVLIREAGKLPPPTVSVVKLQSHISSLIPDISREKRIEIERDVVPRGATVVVVDDVLSTGRTLCAVLELLYEAGRSYLSQWMAIDASRSASTIAGSSGYR
jgi:adenine/guanine phosphoribosyltransferase-like PRPP-binding protein